MQVFRLRVYKIENMSGFGQKCYFNYNVMSKYTYKYECSILLYIKFEIIKNCLKLKMCRGVAGERKGGRVIAKAI